MDIVLHLSGQTEPGLVGCWSLSIFQELEASEPDRVS